MNPTSEYTDATFFDVREIPCRVKHGQIFQRWNSLAQGEFFVLVNDHDPVPLYYQFAAQFPDCFTWEYLEQGPEVFQVKIMKIQVPGQSGARNGAAQGVSKAPSAASVPCCGDDILQVDARGLEPPEPLIRILNALETLPTGTRLRAITDRKPCHLYGEAEQRGFRHNSAEQSDGSWITLLERA